MPEHCPLKPGSRVYAYFRDSGGDRQERSVDQQLQEATAYCQRHGLVLERPLYDAARPGSSTVGRDAFDELVHVCRRLAPTRDRRDPAAPDGIIFWDLKRFARNQLDSAFFKADMRRRGYVLIFLSDQIPDSDIAPVYEAMLEWKAQQDLVDIAKDAKRGLRDLVSTRDPATGEYLGLLPGKPPTGFKGEPYTLGLKRDGTPRVVQRLVPDPATWDRCRRAWEMRATGASYKEVHEATHLLGTLGSYATFFRNRIYTGTLEYGGRTYVDFVPALITEELYDAVQALRKPRYVNNSWRERTDYILSEFLFCGHDGGALSGNTIPARKDAGDGYPRARYRRYTCTRWKNRRGPCSLRHVPADAIEAAVFEALHDQVLRPDHLLQILEESRPDDQVRQEIQREIDDVLAKKAELAESIRRLVDSFERTGFSPHLAARLAEREAELTRRDIELAALQRRLEQAEYTIPFAVLEDFCYNARALLDSGEPDDLRALLRTILVRVEVFDDHTGRLVYTFPLDWRG